MADIRFTDKIVLGLVKQAYLQGTADFTIDPGDCALLVIDLQNEFVKPEWTPYWVPESTKIVPKINQLIDFCRQKSIPLIFTLFSDTHFYYDRPNSGKFMPNRFNSLKIDKS